MLCIDTLGCSKNQMKLHVLKASMVDAKEVSFEEEQSSSTDRVIPLRQLFELPTNPSYEQYIKDLPTLSGIDVGTV